MDLSDVKGCGPSAATKLKNAGIKTVEDLAEIDQRSKHVDGLSQSNVARLRNNARTLLEALNRRDDLTLVDGMGPSAAKKLNEHGVHTIDDLLELDLRTTNIEGLSNTNLQKLKRNARYLTPG